LRTKSGDCGEIGYCSSRPFWSKCVSLISLIDEMTKLHRRFNFLKPVGLPKSLFPVLGCQEQYFRVCIPLGSLLTANVTGVGDSVTWGRWDRHHWERRLSTQLIERICLNPLTLDLLHRTVTFLPIYRACLE
jgi:hypothetical protein